MVNLLLILKKLFEDRRRALEYAVSKLGRIVAA